MEKNIKQLPELIRANEDKQAQNYADFANWLADNGWYRNGRNDTWYQIPKQHLQDINAKDLFIIYKNNPKT